MKERKVLKSRICMLLCVHQVFDTRVFHKEAKTLQQAGYEVTIIGPHKKNEAVDGIKIKSVPKPRNRLAMIILTPCRVFRNALKEKAEIYHFHDLEFILTGLILKVIGKRVIYDVHEDYPKDIMSKYYIPKLLRRFISFFVNIVEKFATHYFDAIIPVTDDIASQFRKHKRVVVIKNYPLINEFLPKNEKKKTDEFRVIYIGLLSRIRGITQMVQAIEYLNSVGKVKLILGGKFDPAPYEKEIRNLKGFEKVEYLGWVEYRRVPEYLSQADIGLICFHPTTNHLTALPNKLFECMAAGLPVIASNFPLWEDIVEGNKCGICIDPLNPKEIAEVIKHLIENHELRNRMGENGRRAVLEKYNWKIESQKLLHLYNSLS